MQYHHCPDDAVLDASLSPGPCSTLSCFRCSWPVDLDGSQAAESVSR